MAITVIRPRDQDDIYMDILNLEAADVDTDASGDITVTFPNLRTVYYAELQIGAGYTANLLSTALNVATFRVYWQANDGGGAAGEVLTTATSESNLAISHAAGWGRK